MAQGQEPRAQLWQHATTKWLEAHGDCGSGLTNNGAHVAQGTGARGFPVAWVVVWWPVTSMGRMTDSIECCQIVPVWSWQYVHAHG